MPGIVEARKGTAVRVGPFGEHGRLATGHFRFEATAREENRCGPMYPHGDADWLGEARMFDNE